MIDRPYVTGQVSENSTVAGILESQMPGKFHSSNAIIELQLLKPILPSLNDTSFATKFQINFVAWRLHISLPVYHKGQLFFMVGLGTSHCNSNQTCEGPIEPCFRLQSITLSFVMPTKALLESQFFWAIKWCLRPGFSYLSINSI